MTRRNAVIGWAYTFNLRRYDALTREFERGYVTRKQFFEMYGLED